MPITVNSTRYNELLSYIQDETLIEKVEFAILVSAELIAASQDADGVGLNTASHRLWARYVVDGQQSRREAIRTLRLLIAENKDATDGQIENTVNNDAALQGLVNTLVQEYSVVARADR
jgi:hypothetical protein